MFAIDTNLLIYAHNEDSEFHKRAVAFLERVMNEQDEDGNPTICFPTQVFTEFINVITRQTLRKPLSLEEAIHVVQEYLDAGIQVISHQETQIQTFLQLLRTVTTRKKMFDGVRVRRWGCGSCICGRRTSWAERWRSPAPPGRRL